MTHIYVFKSSTNSPGLCADHTSQAFGRSWIGSKFSAFKHDDVQVHAVTCGSNVTTAATIAMASAVSKAYVRTRAEAMQHVTNAIEQGADYTDRTLYSDALDYDVKWSSLPPRTNIVNVYDRANDALNAHLQTYTAGDCVTFVHMYDEAVGICSVFSVTRTQEGALTPILLLSAAHTDDETCVWSYDTPDYCWLDDVNVGQHAVMTLMRGHYGPALLDAAATSDASKMRLQPFERAGELSYGGATTLSPYYDVVLPPYLNRSANQFSTTSVLCTITGDEFITSRDDRSL